MDGMDQTTGRIGSAGPVPEPQHQPPEDASTADTELDVEPNAHPAHDQGSGSEPVTAPVAGPQPRLLWAIAAVLSLAIVLAAHGWRLGEPPLPGREQSVPMTGYLAGLLEWTAALAAIGTLGSLLAVAWGYRHPERGRPWKLRPRDYAVLGQARRWASLWATSALLLVPINAADTGGVPISYVLAALDDHLTSNQTTQAWLLTGIAALAITLGCWLSTTWRWVLGMSLVALLAGLPTVVTAQVSVGAGHDLATDAAIFYTLATTLWFAAVFSAGRTAAAIGTGRTVRRVVRIAAVAALIAIVCRLGIGLFELAGAPPLQSQYGLAVTVLIVLLVILAGRVLVRLRSAGRLGPEDEARPQLTANAVDLALIVVTLGVQTALLRLVPPRFLIEQSPTENYLGYHLHEAPELLRALLPGRPNLLLITVALVMIGLYLWGIVRLRRAGDRWPTGRIVAWLIGWSMVLIMAGTNMWAYSSATFSWHMAVHMTLNMGAPVLLVLGGPITLLLRATAAYGDGHPVGLHDVVTGVLGWRLVQVLLHPILVWIYFVGSLYLLYFSPLFDVGMRFHWAHQLMAVHFLITGYLFFWLVIGVDRPPQPLPHIAKLGFVFAAMPFHAFFAVAILSGDAIIGENFYRSLDLPWLTDLAAQQQAGGQVTWATGELPLFVMIIVLVAQWFSQDQREARRKDRAADAGHDDSLEAYNEMLAALAARDRATRSGTGPATPPADDQDRGAGS